MNSIITHNSTVSVLIPCRNEELYISKLIENVLAQDYPKNLLEVFFIDGRSEDKTVEIIHRYISENEHFKLIPNPDMYVPFGLNKAISASSGKVILRMDAHSIYPKNYISELVSHLFDLAAENVGGVWNIRPANDSHVAEAIAFSNGHPFGIGNAQYRYAENDIRLVDTVPFGCYPRRVFDNIGLFDEDLIRNQDDEFNARLKKNGGKIFLIPSVKIDYFARPNFRLMSKMFYQYGLYKPLVNKKLGQISTVRQLFPALLIIGTVTGIGLGIIWSFFVPFILIPWVLYSVIAFSIGTKHFLKFKKLKTSLLIPLSFLIIHLSYGWGYLKGLFLGIIGRIPHIKSHSR